MKYTAISIGPIIETMNQARKTRELWASSYLFSYIIRQMCLKIKENEIEILMPAFDKKSEFENCYGTGLFPDKIIVSSDHPISDIFEAVLDDISKEAELVKVSELGIFLKSYLRFIEVHFETEGNIVDEATYLIDSKEQEAPNIGISDNSNGENPLQLFLYRINKSNILKRAFCDKLNRFPSLIEIATRSLKVLDSEKYSEFETQIETNLEGFGSFTEEKNNRTKVDEESLLKILQDIKYKGQSAFKQSHKYLAVVHADGDKIGKIIAQVGDKGDSIQAFSKKLMSFAQKASEIVFQNSGFPIYMGGDDLLFLAPVISGHPESRQSTIFDLIQKIDQLFISIIKDYAISLSISREDLPSLSFGLSITYFKFPLYEARSSSFLALFEDIKWADKRNALSIKFRKHSGQTFNVFMDKKQEITWKKYLDFVSNTIEGDSNFINSFTHKLMYQETALFNYINNPDPNISLIHFFKNNYNENWDKHSSFFMKIIEIIKEIGADSSITATEKPEFLYSLLRIIHFLRS